MDLLEIPAERQTWCAGISLWLLRLAGRASLIESRTKLVHRATDTIGRVALGYQRKEVLEASQSSANAIETLVHHRSLTP